MDSRMQIISDQDQIWMQKAIEMAEASCTEHDEVPVGAVIVDSEGQLLAEAGNRSITYSDPTAHAEILAMREAGRKLHNYRLLGCTLYVTLEPCAMCAMAMVHARISRLVYAASDPKTGACGSVFDLAQAPQHNHRIEVTAGISADVTSRMLSNYFRTKRGRPLL